MGVRLAAALVAVVFGLGVTLGADDSLERAWGLLRDDRATEAAEEFRKSVATADSSSDAVRGLVTALVRDGRAAEAIQASQSFLDRGPEDATAWAHLGRAYLGAGRFEEAEQAFLESVALADCPLGHWGMGRIAETRGDLGEAEARFAEAHRLAPHDDEILESWLRDMDDPEMERQGWALWLRIDRRGRPSTRAFVEAVLPVFPRYAEHRRARLRMPDGMEPSLILPLKRVPRLADTRLEERRLVVVATMDNGSERRLLLDTGARGLTLSPSAARAAGFQEIASVRLQGAGNRERGSRAKVGVIRGFDLGPLTYRNGLAVRTSASGFPDGVDGILGIDLFAPRIVEIEFDRQILRILPRDATTEGFRLADTRRVDAHILVNVVLAERVRGWFLLDSGSSHTAVDIDAAEGLGGRTRSADWWIKGVAGVLKDLRTVPEATLEVGGLSRRDPGLLAYSLEGISRNLGVRVAGVLGLSFLEGLVVRIDTVGATVALKEAASPEAARKLVEDGESLK